MPARVGTLLLALLLLPSAARAAELPPVERMVPAPVSEGPACTSGGTTSYRAPMAGYLTTRLAGKGDWDLSVRNAALRTLGTSLGFRGSEVVQGWVTAGERVTAVACRRPGARGRARVTFSVADADPVVQKGASRVARVEIDDQSQIPKLEALGFDVTHRQTTERADVVVNGDAELAKLRRTGLDFRIVTNDLYRRDARTLRSDAVNRSGDTSALPSGRTTYREYADYGAELKALVDENPGLVRAVTIGKSFQGRDITGVEIAKDVDGDDGRPVFFAMGVHHAREWPAGEAAMELAYKLVKDRDDPRIAKLLATERVVIVPLVNPDGFVVSRGSYSPSDQVASQGDPTGGAALGQTVEIVAPPGGIGAYRRKNCNGGDPNAPCETKYGVDNNRNYGNLWGGPGSSPDITSQSYRGPSPRSEPETQAVFDFVRANQVTTLITIHTVAGLVLRPPGLAQLGLAPDEDRMREIGDAMASAAGYTSQFSWQLYDTAGTTEDDTYAATGGYGYTYELGTNGGPFHGPYEDSVVKEWTGQNDHAKGKGGVEEALLIAAEAAANPADHAVLKGTAPAGRILRLRKAFKTTTSEYCPSGVSPVLNIQAAPSEVCAGTVQPAITLDDELNSTTTVPAGGSFEWHVGQSTRPFVNGGAVFEKVGDPKSVASAEGGAGGGPGTTEDKELAVPERADRLTISLAPTVPTDDYDIEVLKDGKSLGTSAGLPGATETVELMDAGPGTYVVRVANYAAVGPYTIEATAATVERTVTTGTKESYTLTCEDAAGKVYKTIALTIDRGQVVTANPCDANAPSQIGPPAGSPSTPGASQRRVKIRFTGLRLRPRGAKRRIRLSISVGKGAPATAKGRFRLVTKLNGRTRFVASRRFALKPGQKRVVSPIVRRRVYRALRRGKRIRLQVRLTGKAGQLGLEVVTRNFKALKRPR